MEIQPRVIKASLYEKKNQLSYFSTKTYVVGTQKNHLNEMFVCLFDSLRPINNLSVIYGRVFLG